MEKDKANEIQALLKDVFALTGQKVTIDDPILVAALIQSSLVKRAGADAATSLQNAVVDAVSELAKAVKVEREQAAQLDRTVAEAFVQISESAKIASDKELVSMQTKFARNAAEVLDHVRRESDKYSPKFYKTKLMMSMCVGCFIGLGAGLFVVKTGARGISDDQMRLIHNGALLDNAWAKLPKSAKDLIENSAKGVIAPVDELKRDKKS